VLDAEADANNVSFTLVRTDGQRLRIGSLVGKLGAFSWNSQGLAAVVGERLVIWPQGGNEFIELARDPGLPKARDVVLVGPDRAVAALGSGVVLLSKNTRLPLAGLQARVRWSHDFLYLLDVTTGVIWKVQGLQKVGTLLADRGYAKALIAALPKTAPESHTAFLEAARIVGCVEARKMR